ncbi:phosphatidate cytidylyltransferase [Rhizobiaceae bacterium n13]|uniref:Phosphatidate cytidylyltransferase n=1 Tax=Ferirhizobium litorale TaxID=2927786 RepID=A0AAE3U2V1_9HYPH|nr:phosphatidate cytidylyltransferase [Fererhizobium litorale]MDI7864013.1 phosphatidate cytidylyltransferase [Fererhizobium litorale]MDI7924504.1 phosphatidate cytidylyltransferase [Fererhizobium litorale]
MSEELRLRIVSGIVLAVVVLVSTWYGGIGFRLLAAAISLLVYYEWSTITKLAEKDFQANAIGWLGTALVAAVTVLGEFDYAIPLLLIFTVLTAILSGLRRGSWWLPGGVFYSALSGISLAAIRGEDSVGLAAMLFVFAVVWATDILAYFVGRAVGGPKLAPKISPGKTWSGAIGGTISGVIAGTAVALVQFPNTGIWVACIALLLSVSSQVGDLFESFLKRRFGVKDSSRLIPGHGGVMDRVDGLVFACFAAFLLAIGLAATRGDPAASLGGLLLGL